MFVSEGKRHNETFGGNGERPNVLYGGRKKRSSTLSVDKGERPNALSEGEWKDCCGVKNGREEQSTRRVKGMRPMALF